jgi:hypothetical protein
MVMKNGNDHMNATAHVAMHPLDAARAAIVPGH